MIEDRTQYIDIDTVENLHRYLVHLDGRARATEAAVTYTMIAMSGLAPDALKAVQDSLRNLSESVLEGEQPDPVSDLKRHAMSQALLSLIETTTVQARAFTVIKGGLDSPESD